MKHTIQSALLIGLLSFTHALHAATDYFTASETTPVGCVNVKTEAGAVGNGVTDDTAAINTALASAYAQNKDVYFPAGKYLISSGLVPKNNVILRGSVTGISMLQAPAGTTVTCGTGDFYADDQNNVAYEDLFFNRVGINYYTNRSNGMRVSRCAFFSSDNAVPVYAVAFSNPNNTVVEDCVIMKSDKAPGEGVFTYKTSYATIRRNLFGVDYGNMGWIATSYPGNPYWNQLTDKLHYLRDQLDLSWDQGEFKTAIRMGNYDDNAVVCDNVMNGSPRRLVGGVSDHVIYAKAYTNLKFYRNWTRGWPRDASGGVKFRNGTGLAIAANLLDDTGIIVYTQSDPTDMLFFNNALIYRNRLIERTNLNGWATGIQYYKYMGTEAGNAIAANTFECPVGGARFWFGKDSSSPTELDPTAFSVYSSNVFAGTTTTPSSNIPVIAGAPDPTWTAPYDNMVVPTHNIPAFSLPPVVSDATVTFTGNVPEFTTVYDVNATDGNSGVPLLTYTIVSGNDDGLFTIDTLTGEIRVTRYVRYKNFASRSIVVRVSDVRDVTADATITFRK